MSHEGTTLKQYIPKQEQDLPGLQKEMEPHPIDTKLETASGPKEHVGIGKLKGKKALITGGEYVSLTNITVHGRSPLRTSSGVGRAVAILFAREGADVTIIHLPQEQKDADDTVKAIENEGRKGLSIAFDLENFKQADEVIKKHIDTFGRLDILVNNASKHAARLHQDRPRLGREYVQEQHPPDVCHHQVRAAAHGEGCEHHQHHVRYYVLYVQG